MKIVFRADASEEIGSGHVMRCLSLARNLRDRGAECHFICRQFDGNLAASISDFGFGLTLLNGPTPEGQRYLGNSENFTYRQWLGCSQFEDAIAVADIIGNLSADWLVVDHYGIDKDWENIVSLTGAKIFVIDDLADRTHFADVLLDQTFGRSAIDYKKLVNDNCRLLVGSDFALLRPEFRKYRTRAVEQRKSRKLNNLLVSLGGVDKDNFTQRVLQTLENCDLPSNLDISVVVGEKCPWISQLTDAAAQFDGDCKLLVGVQNMAALMARADLAIGASGTSSWERCALGLPSIQLIIAENQRLIAENLAKVGAIKLAKSLDEIPAAINTRHHWMEKISDKSASLVDGLGSYRAAEVILGH